MRQVITNVIAHCTDPPLPQAYFQGPLLPVSRHVNNCADQQSLRDCVPENRLRVYDMQRVIDILADTGSLTFLRSGFGVGIFTALARFGGRTVGIVANNPRHLGGTSAPNNTDAFAMSMCS